MERCYAHRQSVLATQHRRPPISHRALLGLDMNARWIKCNKWVVSGLVVTDHAFELVTHHRIRAIGKKSVLLDMRNSTEGTKKGVAISRVGPYGKEYAVRVRNKLFALLQPTPQ